MIEFNPLLIGFEKVKHLVWFDPETRIRITRCSPTLFEMEYVTEDGYAWRVFRGYIDNHDIGYIIFECVRHTYTVNNINEQLSEDGTD